MTDVERREFLIAIAKLILLVLILSAAITISIVGFFAHNLDPIIPSEPPICTSDTVRQIDGSCTPQEMW